MAEQILNVTFGPGLDGSTRAELVDPSVGALDVLNCDQATVGARTKSPGYEALSKVRADGGTRAAGKRVIAHADVPGVIDGYRLDLWMDADVASGLVDNVVPFSMTRQPVFSPNGGYDPGLTGISKTPAFSWYDFVVVGDIGVAVYSWLPDSTGLKTLSYVVWSVSSGVVLRHALLSDGSLTNSHTGVLAQLVAVGTEVDLFFEDGTAASILGSSLDATSVTTATAGFGAPGVVVADWTEGSFAACSDGTKVYLAYDSLDFLFNPAITAARLAPLFVVEQSSNVAFGSLPAAVRALAVDVLSGRLWIMACVTGNINARLGIVDPANVAAAIVGLENACTGGGATAEPIHLGVKAVSSTQAWVCATANIDVASGNRLGWCGRTMDWAGAWTKGTNRQWPSLATLSAPFLVESRAYAWVLQNSSVFSSSGTWGSERVVACVALDEDVSGIPYSYAAFSIAPVVALPAPRLMVYAGAPMGAAPGSLPFHMALRPTTTSTTAGILLPRLTNAIAIVFDWVEITTDDPRRWDSKHMARTTHLAGAVTTGTDGVVVTETNFCMRPILKLDVAAGVGALTGTFSYIAIYEDCDASGDVSWSATSDPVSSGAIVAKNMVVTVSGLSLTRRRASRGVVYRTTNGGSTYYRCLQFDSGQYGAAIIDSTTDAQLQTAQRLYGMGALPTTAGATQPRQAPPGLRTVFRHGDRLVGIADDRATLWYSAPTVQGEARWFSDVFQLPIDSLRPLTAAWSQDGSMIAATETELWAISGDGPPENGGNGTEFTSPQRISSDVGCIEPRSVVTTSAGTFFQASRGIHVLTRALSAEWIGLPIADVLAAFPTIVAALHDQGRNAVMFDCIDVAGTYGVTLVYDMMTRAWNTERRYESANHGVPSVDGCMVRLAGVERHHWLAADGTVYRRRLPLDASLCLDTATWRTMRYSTAWFKVAGLAGYGQIKRLELMFKLITNTDLHISYYYDDNPTPVTITRNAAQLVAANGRLDLLPAEQKCRTFRVTLEDATPGAGPIGNGTGIELYGLALGYEPLGGVDRRPNASR